MPAVVTADTSSLIYLTRLGLLNLLARLCGQVLITPTVAAEHGGPLPAWMRVSAPRDEIKTLIFGARIDSGAAGAIALALETPNGVLVLDDQRGRRAAQRLQLNVTGTLGSLISAKQNGLVPAIRPLVQRLLAQETYLSPALEATAYRLANEQKK